MTATTFPRRLFVNSAAIFGGEAIARLATALMALVIARFYGMEALGDYGYTLALASILLIVPDFGLHLFTARELSSAPQRLPEIFWNVHWVKLVLTGVVGSFAITFGVLGIADRQRRLLFYALVARVLLQSFSHAAMAVFKGLERMHYIALQQSINSAVIIVWVTACIALQANLSIMVAGLVVGQLAETLMGWNILSRLLAAPGVLIWNRQAIARIAAASFPFGLTAILLALNLRIDILVLSRYVSSRILGQFNAAAWFVVAMFLAASLLMSVLFPRLSRILARQTGLGSDYIRTLIKNVVMFAAMGSMLIWISAPFVIRVFFGPDFSPAAHILRILAPALPLVFLNTIFFYIFAAARRRFVCLCTLSLGIGLGTLLSVYLSARYGAAGAATADVAREFAMSGAYLGFLIQGNHARLAGIALLRVFAGATALLLLTVRLAGVLHIQFMWFAAWTLFLLMGALVALGLPNLREWRLLTDDHL